MDRSEARAALNPTVITFCLGIGALGTLGACSASEENSASAPAGNGSTTIGGSVAAGGTNMSTVGPSSGSRSATGGSSGTRVSSTASSSGGQSTTSVNSGTTEPSSSCDRFSFFVTSLVALRRESGNDKGFGGDLGGLQGADELCRRIAENSLGCAGQKTWHAFLSTGAENAIDRVGTGPWYDRMGRLVANTTSDLLNTRPRNADATIINDLPNEFGVPNRNPDGTQVDNHDMLTGSNSQGRLYGASATCSDWTSTTASGKPRLGHSYPGGPSQHWINAMDAEGCAAGYYLQDNPPNGNGGNCVGCSGGYGGFYCFALTP